MGLFSRKPLSLNDLAKDERKYRDKVDKAWKYAKKLKTFDEQESWLRSEMKDAMDTRNTTALGIGVDIAYNIYILSPQGMVSGTKEGKLYKDSLQLNDDLNNLVTGHVPIKKRRH